MPVLSHELPELPDGVLPVRPVSLQPFDRMRYQTYDEEASDRLERGRAITIGGLTLLGELGHVVLTVGIMTLHAKSEERLDLRGWALHLYHPNPELHKWIHFDTAEDEDVELPIPNMTVYFGSEVHRALTERDADPQELARIAHFALAFMSDDGPPAGIDWQ